VATAEELLSAATALSWSDLLSTFGPKSTAIGPGRWSR
jgi:hypothetical protein